MLLTTLSKFGSNVSLEWDPHVTPARIQRRLQGKISKLQSRKRGNFWYFKIQISWCENNVPVFVSSRVYRCSSCQQLEQPNRLTVNPQRIPHSWDHALSLDSIVEALQVLASVRGHHQPHVWLENSHAGRGPAAPGARRQQQHSRGRQSVVPFSLEHIWKNKMLKNVYTTNSMAAEWLF